MKNDAIYLDTVVKTYPGVVPTQVLKGVSLAITGGSLTAIVGQSGSGKTTLMNCIGLLDLPSSGAVFLNEMNIAERSQRELAMMRNELLGFIFQFHYLLPEFTVLENVLMPAYLRKGSMNASKDDVTFARELLQDVGLADFEHVLASNISGGQQQRVAIARALMNKPAIVLADEPTGNLDSVNGAQILQLFRDINKQRGTTFVIVTHDDRVASVADEVITIADGRVVSQKKQHHG